MESCTPAVAAANAMLDTFTNMHLQVKELEEKVARLENCGGESGNKEEEEKRRT